MDTNPGQLRVLQGRNEQGMCHVATAFAKQSNRKKIIPCASSVGPGAANMVTACATATVNNIPLLVFPADTFASRQPDPVLQQLEQSNSLATTTNDAFKPVCKVLGPHHKTGDDHDSTHQCNESSDRSCRDRCMLHRSLPGCRR